MTKDVKKDENGGKIDTVMEPDNQNDETAAEAKVEAEAEAEHQQRHDVLMARMAKMMATLLEMTLSEMTGAANTTEKTDIEDDGEDDGVTREAQQLQHDALMVTQQQRYNAFMATMATMMAKPAEGTHHSYVEI